MNQKNKYKRALEAIIGLIREEKYVTIQPDDDPMGGYTLIVGRCNEDGPSDIIMHTHCSYYNPDPEHALISLIDHLTKDGGLS